MLRPRHSLEAEWKLRSRRNSPTFDEALRLVLAFYCIMETDKREIIMALVEKHADRSRLTEASVEKAIDLFSTTR